MADGALITSLWERHPRLMDADWVEAYDLSSCWTKTHPNEAYEELDVAVAILRFLGNLSQVGLALGRSRRSVQGQILQNRELREFLQDVESSFMDEVEMLQKKVALSGDPNAQRFFLMQKGRDRGYGLPGGAQENPTDKSDEVNRDASIFARRMASLAARAVSEGNGPVIPGGEGSLKLPVAGVVGEGKPASSGGELVHLADQIRSRVRED